jgi:hypothetical protein
MKVLALLVTLIVPLQLLADCQSDLRALQNRKTYKLIKERTIRLLNKRHLKFLTAVETRAVIDYMRFRNFTFDGDNGVDVTNEAYLERISEQEVGHRISITDGDDDSLVRYYFKGDRALYRSWVGRQYDYLCEK